MKRPFLYIGALRRSGSTLLCEALTQPPFSFLFIEPNFARNTFTMQERDAKILRELDVDLPAFARRWSGLRRFRVLHAFAWELVPQLASRVEQVGVKEIFHDRWRRYLKLFPGMKIVLTARDPRDIYISLHHRQQSGRAIWTGAFTPERVAADLEGQFRRQREMAEAAPCLKVRYEDLCTDAATFERVKAFAGSGIPGIGEVGSYVGPDPHRSGEHAVHGDRITDRRVGRWRHESDAGLRREAERMLGLMPGYAAFWEYE